MNADALANPGPLKKNLNPGSGESLHVRNWTELWTQVHLEQRLLKPLGGIRLTITERYDPALNPPMPLIPRYIRLAITHGCDLTP